MWNLYQIYLGFIYLFILESEQKKHVYKLAVSLKSSYWIYLKKEIITFMYSFILTKVFLITELILHRVDYVTFTFMAFMWHLLTLFTYWMSHWGSYFGQRSIVYSCFWAKCHDRHFIFQLSVLSFHIVRKSFYIHQLHCIKEQIRFHQL